MLLNVIHVFLWFCSTFIFLWVEFLASFFLRFCFFFHMLWMFPWINSKVLSLVFYRYRTCFNELFLSGLLFVVFFLLPIFKSISFFLRERGWFIYIILLCFSTPTVDLPFLILIVWLVVVLMTVCITKAVAPSFIYSEFLTKTCFRVWKCIRD